MHGKEYHSSEKQEVESLLGRVQEQRGRAALKDKQPGGCETNPGKKGKRQRTDGAEYTKPKI